MTRARVLLVASAVLFACGGPVVDTTDLEATDDYQSWKQIVATGPLPAHGDTVRLIYANDIAASWPGSGPYPVGTTVIKEVHAAEDDGSAGELSYIAIARRLEVAPPGGELQDGWLFTLLADDIRSDEEHRTSCWDSCHVAAPLDGLFHDYGR